MKQAKNEVFIEGILLESDIKVGTSNKDNRPYIRGEIRIQVEQTINGEKIESIVPVRMFAMQYTNSGDLNPAYESIIRVRDNFISAAAAGDPALADAVRISKGSLNENIFVPKGSDKEVSFPEIQSNFIQKINRSSIVPVTRFTVNVAVNSIKEEVKYNEPTDALILRGGVVQYNDKLDIIDFKIYNEAAKNHIQTNYNPGDTVNISGYINFSIKTEYVEEEAGFGDAIAVPKTTTVRELVITTGSVEPFDEERAYAKADLNKALAERLARINELKENSKAAAAQTSDKPARGDYAGF
jgi:hypothetical protein